MSHNQPFIVGIYVRDRDGTSSTTVGEIEVPVFSWYGPFRDTEAAASWISRTTGGRPKEDTYEIHDFT